MSESSLQCNEWAVKENIPNAIRSAYSRKFPLAKMHREICDSVDDAMAYAETYDPQDKIVSAEFFPQPNGTCAVLIFLSA